MNFVKRIKEDARHPRNMPRPHYRASVESMALHYFIEDYDRIDAELRAYKNNQINPEFHQVLSAAVKASYHENNKSSERTMMVIFETLLPLMP